MSRRPAPRARTGVLVGVALVAAAAIYSVRPVFHGFALFVWTSPLVWFPPLVVLVATAVLVRRRGNWSTLEDLQRGRRLPSRALITGAVVALFLLIAGSAVNGALTARSLYKATTYTEIPALPASGTVRLIPKEVAEQIAAGGFNSPTERLTSFRIVRTADGLKWTALRTPNGAVRTFTKKSQGIVSLNAESTARNLVETDAEFKYAPGLQVTDNLRWQLLKKHYFITLGETVGILDGAGKPLIAVPYTKYEGWLVRRPAFGGVFVVHPDGRIEDLSPAEARKRPELVASGRIFPEGLARKIQDAYAYKRGLWNKWFIHEEQTAITDTEANAQPYLIDFGRAGGTKWVTVAEPYGRAFAANAVFLTDSVTGRTAIWRVPRGQSLTGNRRALQTVRSLTIPGVVFAGSDRQNPAGGGGGFRAVEPRPVFVKGRLVYLISIVPETANSVSKTVIIDAASNKQVAIFDNDSDPQAETKTLRYLETGVVPGAQDAAPAQDAEQPATGSAPSGGKAPSPAAVRKRIDALIARQRELLRDTEALRRALGQDAP